MPFLPLFLTLCTSLMSSSKLDARAVVEYLTSIRDRFDDDDVKRKQLDRVIDTLQDR